MCSGPNFTIATTRIALMALADSMAAHGIPLGVNDESLSMGGLFDLNADWAPPSHCSHRDGVAIDIQNKFFTVAQEKFVERIWNALPHSAGSKQESDHLHLKISR
jgi:hypothetical protein